MRRSSAPLIQSLLAGGTDLTRRILRRAAAHRLQIILTQLAPPGSRNEPHTTHTFRADSEYFYPASTVKLCSAIAALVTLDRLAKQRSLDISPDTPMVIHPCFPDQKLERLDPTNQPRRALRSGRSARASAASSPRAGCITVAHEIRKACLVSDNPAHNRLLALVGHREINELLWGLGLASVRLNHRLSEPRTLDENRRTPRVDLLIPSPSGSARTITIPARDSTLHLDNAWLAGLDVGLAHIDARGRRHEGPMSFLHKNRISLRDLHRLITLVTRPDLAPPPALGLSTRDQRLLVDAMTRLPRRSHNPIYNAADHPDAAMKPLLPGLARVRPAREWVITNKLGQAYGFTTENAHVLHRPSGRAFLLTATLYANASGVMNADTYDDKTVAEPFLADLGELLARHLLAPRASSRQPDRAPRTRAARTKRAKPAKPPKRAITRG